MSNEILNGKRCAIRRVTMLLVFFIASFRLLAQDKQITGRVTAGDTDSALAGASVTIKGTRMSTATGTDGTFKLTAPQNATLLITAIGYAPQEIPISGRSTLAIRLTADPKSLQQIVVVGYGTQKRKDVSGSISSISAEQIAKVPVTTLDQAIQGRSAGVQVTNNDGAPGGGVQVQIRGVGSFSSNDPLYVVDGYPLSGGINTINPSDIATIDILKDASATAIYGNRASNGVVMITTKRGRRNGTQVSVDIVTALQAKPKTYKVLNGPQWGALAFQHAAIDGYTALPNWANADTLHTADWQDAVYQTGLRQNYNVAIRGGSDKVQTAFSAGYFNQKGVVLGSTYKRYNLSGNIDYTATSWLKSSTSLKYTRGDTKLPFGTGGQGASAGIGYLSKLPPTLDGGNLLTSRIKDGNGNYGFFNPNNQAVRNWGSGPVYMIETQDQKNYTNYFLGSTSLEATIIPGLRVKTNFGINTNDYSGYYYTPPDTRTQQQYGMSTQATADFYSQSANNTFEWLWENTVAYTKTFGDHSIDFVAGFSAQENTFRQIGGQGTGLASTALRSLGALQTITKVYGNQTTTTLESQFARLNYTYKDKYLFQASVRRDGSSKFAEGHQYGVFPSGSVGWRIKQESFLQDVSAISDLKIRASYGEIGNQLGIPPFQYLAQYTSGPGQTDQGNNGYPFNKTYQPGLILAALSDPTLKWETSKQTDIGVDAAFLEGALTLTVDYYKKKSKDFLLNLPISPQSGFPNATRNVGSIDNHGFEFALNYGHTAAGGFHYNVGFNVTTVSNKLLSLVSGVNSLPNLSDLGFPTTGSNNWGTYSKTYVGGPVGEFYGYKSAGIFQTQKEIDDLNAIAQAKYGVNYQPTNGPAKSAVPGDRKFVDINHDGRITADSDQVALGSPIPKFYGGVTFDASYKNWDISIFFYGTYGNKIYNYQQRTLESFGTSTGSVGLENIGLKYFQGAWTSTNPSNRYARIDANEFNVNTRPSDQYIENGSYLRLRNFTLGYTLPLKASGNFAPKMRIYFTGQNLFTITKYSGLDPEIGVPQGTDITNKDNTTYRNVTAAGIDVGTYPSSRYYTVGLNFTF
ncbi:MAG: TonB-dependent receptor [Chitinophagaceae bacterium]|nr:TonB-dependent receptor [Chitinophagaceae bacterium]